MELSPLVAEPFADPFVAASPDVPLFPVSPLVAEVVDFAEPLPPETTSVDGLPLAPLPDVLLAAAAPVLPLLPVLPLPAIPMTDGLEMDAPVLPPVAEEEAVVWPLAPEVASPVAFAAAAPVDPPVELPIADPEFPETEMIFTPPDPPPVVAPLLAIMPMSMRAMPVVPETGVESARPPAPLLALAELLAFADPVLPDLPAFATEVAEVPPLVAEPCALP